MPVLAQADPPGGLSISVPASTDLGTPAPGDTVTATLGGVRVDDERPDAPGA